MAEADAAAPVQHQFFAPQLDFFLALDGDVAAVGALVDEHEFVAPPLDFGVHARCPDIFDHNIRLGIPAQGDGGVIGVNDEFMVPMNQAYR